MAMPEERLERRDRWSRPMRRGPHLSHCPYDGVMTENALV